MPGDLEQLITGLRRPAAYEHAVGVVRVVQTHISYVLLAGEYAYKIKKPLDLGFLDYSTLERRRHMCEEEVRLNRRLCDGVYLGVVGIYRHADGIFRMGEGAGAVEYAVKMRRVPPRHTMPRLLDAGRITSDHLASLAATVAAFHREADTDDRIAAFGRVPAIRRNWEENFAQTTAYLGRTLTSEQRDTVRAYVDRFLNDHAGLIEERAATGRVRDGHGDLRADAVVLAPGGSVCVMDCIEFNDRLRCGDIASDVAFLAMDLEFRGHRREADEFVSMYMESLGGDHTLPLMLNFYRAYRAFVRGKVDSMQASEPEVPARQRAKAADRATRYFHLAQMYAERTFPPAVITMVGLSGAGKSFVASALAGRAGAALLSTDAIRREQAPPSSLGPAPYAAGVYAPEQRELTYNDLLARAGRQLELGRSVVLDATFLTRRQRALAKQLSTSAHVPLFVVQVAAPEDLTRARLGARASGGVSDARWDTYLAQRARFEPLDDIEPERLVRLDATRPLDALVEDVLRALETATKPGHSARRSRS